MQVLKIITYILVLVGAINWGLVGIFYIDLVEMIFGDMTVLARVVYSLVGISAIVYAGLSYRDTFEKM